MTFAEFQRKHGLRYNADHIEDHLPCYINRRQVVDSISTKTEIKKYIRLAVDNAANEDEWERIGVLLFSVTERDKHFQKWLDVAEERNYIVIEGPSIHGPYKCWSVIVPTGAEMTIYR